MTMTDFEINDASDACFDLAEDSNVTLRDGEMTDCNSGGNSWGALSLTSWKHKWSIDYRKRRYRGLSSQLDRCRL